MHEIRRRAVDIEWNLWACYFVVCYFHFHPCVCLYVRNTFYFFFCSSSLIKIEYYVIWNEYEIDSHSTGRKKRRRRKKESYDLILLSFSRIWFISSRLSLFLTLSWKKVRLHPKAAIAINILHTRTHHHTYTMIVYSFFFAFNLYTRLDSPATKCATTKNMRKFCQASERREKSMREKNHTYPLQCNEGWQRNHLILSRSSHKMLLCICANDFLFRFLFSWTFQLAIRKKRGFFFSEKREIHNVCQRSQ